MTTIPDGVNLLVLEGPDGVGKTSLAKFLARRWANAVDCNGDPILVAVVGCPSATEPVGAALRQAVKDGPLNPRSRATALWFAAARAETRAETNRLLADRPRRLVIQDRGMLSGLVYQARHDGRDSFSAKRLLELELKSLDRGDCLPDATFVMSATVSVIEAVLAARKEKSSFDLFDVMDKLQRYRLMAGICAACNDAKPLVGFIHSLPERQVLAASAHEWNAMQEESARCVEAALGVAHG